MKRALLGLLALALCAPGTAAERHPSPTGAATEATLTDVWTGINALSSVGGGNSNCLVVTGDQSYTLGATQQLTCTGSGRLRIGLSSATNIAPGAAPTNTSASDLVACRYAVSTATWSDLWQGALGCTATGELRVNDAALITAVQSTIVPTGTSGNPAGATLSIQDNNAVLSLSPAPIGTTTGAFFTQALGTNGAPFNLLGFDISTIGAGAQAQVQVSMDCATNWTPIQVQYATNASATTTITTVGAWSVAVPYGCVRLQQTVAPSSGSTTVHALFSKGAAAFRNVQVAGSAAAGATAPNPVGIGCKARTANSTVGATTLQDVPCTLAGGLVNWPYSIPEHSWPYVPPSGGLTTATAQTMVAAASGVRNYVMACQAANPSATGTEIQIHDGAAGANLWDGYLAPNLPLTSIPLPIPLRGSVNTLIEVRALTAGAAAYVNCQGVQAP